MSSSAGGGGSPAAMGNRAGTLRLSRGAKPPKREMVSADSLDVRLPCRSFSISYKVAEAGQHTLTSEFLLRLLRTSGDLPEDVIAEFFGFEAPEIRYVIDEAEKRSLVSRVGGRVQLAPAGRAAFGKGGDKPHLYEVHQKRGRFDFDVVSFAPAETEQLTPFARELCELPILSEGNLADASGAAREAFRRHFRELRISRRGSEPETAELYTIDDVSSDRRRDAVVPLVVDIPVDNPKGTIANLQEWESGPALGGRDEVVASCTNLLQGLHVDSTWTDEEAYKLLVDAAPSQSARFRRVDGFDRLAYFRYAAGRTGDLRADRRTVPALGTLWTGRNVEQLGAAVRLLRREQMAAGPAIVFWLRPALSQWGSNLSLPEFVGGLTGELDPVDDDGPERRYVSLAAGAAFSGPLHQRCKRTFDGFVSLNPAAVPAGLEVFLIPRRLAAVLVHGAMDAKGFPIPVGILSVDPLVVERAHGIVDEMLSRAATATAWDGVEPKLRESLEEALEFAAPEKVSS